MDINIKIAEIKSRIKDITKHFPYTEFEINILTISYIAIASIDNDITDILDEVLSRIFILFNNGEFNELLKELDAPLNVGGCYLTPEFNSLEKDYYEFICINLFRSRIFSKIDIGLLFDSILHELKHAINTIINERESTIYSYCGLSRKRYCKKGFDFAFIDEAFNAFITDIYLKEIAKLQQIDITDPNIKSILSQFKNNQPYSYDCTNLLVKLFNDAEFFKLFYNATIYRDILPLYTELTKTLFLSTNAIEQYMTHLNILLERYERSSSHEIFDYFRIKTKGYPKRELKIKSYYDNI